MVTPEAAEAQLQALMAQQKALVGLVLMDVATKTVISALLPPGLEAGRLAGQVYTVYRARAALYVMLDDTPQHGLFWGETTALAFRATGPLLLAAVIALPAQVGVLLTELQHTLDAFSAG